jgi:uncharacterized SAM-binding protein YcdF (DUF218 family)
MRTAVFKLFLAVPTYVLVVLGLLLFISFKRRAAPRLRRWRYALVAAFVATYLIGTPAFSKAIAFHIEHTYEPRPIVNADRHPDNLILVLTGGWFRWVGNRVDLKISKDGWERLDAGVKLWQQIGGTILIVGAPSPDGSGNSIAAVMAAAARERGVPAAALMIESQSLDTHENIVYSLPTLEAHADHLWLVTSAIHMPRAMAVAKKSGLRPIPYPCFYTAPVGWTIDDLLPANEGAAGFEIAMHEWLGLLFYRIRGWA